MAGIIAVSPYDLRSPIFFGYISEIYFPTTDLWSRCLRSYLWIAYVTLPRPTLIPLTFPSVQTKMSLAQGVTHLGAGLSVGLAGLAAGFAVGIVGDAGVRGTAQQPRLFVGMVRLLI